MSWFLLQSVLLLTMAGWVGGCGGEQTSPAEPVVAAPAPETEHADPVESTTDACEDQDLTACYRLGNAHEAGVGVPQDHAAAIDLYGRACEGGYVLGCRAAGLLSVKEGNDTATVEQGVVWLDRACNDGFLDVCAIMTDMYLKGIGVARQPATGAQYLVYACSNGYREGCLYLDWIRDDLEREGIQIFDADPSTDASTQQPTAEQACPLLFHVGLRSDGSHDLNAHVREIPPLQLLDPVSETPAGWRLTERRTARDGVAGKRGSAAEVQWTDDQGQQLRVRVTDMFRECTLQKGTGRALVAKSPDQHLMVERESLMVANWPAVTWVDGDERHLRLWIADRCRAELTGPSTLAASDVSALAVGVDWSRVAEPCANLEASEVVR